MEAFADGHFFFYPGITPETPRRGCPASVERFGALSQYATPPIIYFVILNLYSRSGRAPCT